MATSTRAPARRPVMRHPHAAPRPVRRKPQRRWRRVLTIAALVCLVPAVASFADMLTKPSDSSLSIRTVEWLRDNGARGIVNRVENFYYSLNAPSKGGPALKALPPQAGVSGAVQHSTKRRPYYRPPNIHPLIHPALRGEGVWRATFAPGGSRPPVLVTSYRPQPDYPQLVAGVAWIDHTRTSTWLYPGRLEPAVSLASRGPMEIPQDMRSKLVASFNSGFKLSDSGGGFATGGHTYAPLKNGLATIVRYRNGRVNLIAWNGGPTAGPNVVYARQNLPLIVNHGRANPNLSDGPEWGATLGNAVQVWRSAIGIDKFGNLLYTAAAEQSVGSLAAILIHAGAVRAMEMDINTYWTSFVTYRHPGAAGAANLLSTMDRSPQRYLTPDDRDFFGVYIH